MPKFPEECRACYDLAADGLDERCNRCKRLLERRDSIDTDGFEEDSRMIVKYVCALIEERCLEIHEIVRKGSLMNPVTQSNFLCRLEAHLKDSL